MSALPRTALARGVAAAVTATVTAALLITPGLTGAAHAATPEPADVAAGWLSGQLAGGDHMETVFSGTAYPDAGLTADVVFALDAAGVAQSAATKATTWLKGQVATYTGDGTTESYAGALAKLSLVAEAQGQDPHAFGGSDLLARLSAQMDAGSGRFKDVSAYGDYSNAITQSLAVLALKRDAAAPALAVDYLVGQQCPNGGFPVAFEQASCGADVDATGYAVQALRAVGRTSAVDAALTWLTAQQRSNGGFGGSGPTAETNSNSTGLAVVALSLGGRTAAADAGRAYLLSLQVGCSGAAADRGAIAYDAAGFSAGTAPRATSQAIPGLAAVGLDTVTSSGTTQGFPTLACAAPVASPVVTPPAGTMTGSGSGGAVGTPVSAPVAAPAAAPVAAAPELPLTGGPIQDSLVLGGLLLLSGLGFVAVGRRREHPAA